MKNKFNDIDRAMGAYIGGAIGDAMGGPIEGNHAARIQRLCGEVTGYLPYEAPHYLGTVGTPGGALHADPGSVTDDTFLRAEVTRFLLNTEPPRTADKLAHYFIKHAKREYFWYPKLEPLERIARNEVKPENAGMEAPQGGGASWWTPIGILFAKNPVGAAEKTRELSRIWKAPFEQDLLAASQAAVAEGLKPDASVDSMIEAMLDNSGPLARKLLERGIQIGEEAKTLQELIYRLYHNALMPENTKKASGYPESEWVIKESEGPMPPVHQPLDDTDDRYITNALAEQIPFAVAAFVFEKGTPKAITTAVMLGRDADSIGSMVGAWVGALNGESGLPKEWVDVVCDVNQVEIDIRKLGEALIKLEG